MLRLVWLVAALAILPVRARPCRRRPRRPIDFDRDVRPLLAKHCYACHGPDKQKGGLRLDRKAAALKGGDERAGRSCRARRPRARSSSSPPALEPTASCPRRATRLTAEQVGVLRAWIDQGADWPGAAGGDDGRDWWSLRPADPPGRARPLGRRRGPRAQPDRRVRPGQAAREGAGARRRRPTGGRSIRRLSFDLIGLPPTPEEIDAFVDRPGPDAYERLVDRLLASPALRRALGPALARRGPLRRHPRLRQGPAAAERLALPRLRDPGVQRRQAVRPVRPRAGRRRRALPRHGRRHRRPSGSSPPGRGTSSATPRCRRRRSTARSPGTSTATTWWPTRSTRSSA